jgi:hypothetical protein
MGTLRDAILAAEDLPREEVQTPEWGPAGAPTVFVRGFTSKERDDWEMSLTVAGPDGSRIPNPRLKNLRAGFVVRVLVDKDGNRIFEDKDVEVLSAKSASVLDRLWDVGRRLSGMDNVQTEPNPSTGDQEDGNSSDSPSPSESQTQTT